ncbi:MAG TPA: ABC transporter substrate-binding protein [Acidimicrobiia bacterium]|nr:ABC transporter substrate-binding protein [Acidimicrobiia bacterium]
MGSRRGVRAVVAAVAVLVTVSLFGVAEAGAQQNPPVNEPGVTNSEIRVGGVGTVSNDPTGNNPGGPAFDGAQAYFDYVNSSGGVCGRKLVLASKRDDVLANNRQEVQGLLDDNVFAALPIATSLFSGAELLVSQGIPTFGWLINGEWGSEDANPGPSNLFGQSGSFLNLKTAGPSYYSDAWLAQKLNKKRLGLIAYNVPQSSGSSDAIEQTFQKFPKSGKVVFKDTSLSFGAVDYSVQVSKMKDEKVNLVIPSVDANGAFTLAREMKKQGLNAPMILPNAYNQERIEKNADVANGNYLAIPYAPFQTTPKPAGLKRYEKWIKKSGGTMNENSYVGWLNADLFVRGLKAAGCDFTRQKVIDAINKMTNYNADGILPPVDWTKAHTQAPGCFAFLKVENAKFKPVFGQSGKPFLCFPADLTSIPTNPEAVG